MQTISEAQARQFLVTHHYLAHPRTLEGKQGILQYLDRVGCIQFDPLNVVGVNPHVVLQSRIKNFKPALLDSLLYEDRVLIDHFDKQLAIYPVKDWPNFARRRANALAYYSHPDRPAVEFAELIRDELERRGPLSSLDIEFEKTIQWHWGTPTRISRAVMESMYAWGELIVHHKTKGRKVYDLAYRHLPEDILSAPDPNQKDEDYHAWHTLRRIGGLGLAPPRAGDAWLGMAFKTPERRKAMKSLLNRGLLQEIYIEGHTKPYYLRTVDQPTLENVINNRPPAPQAAIIAALDNFIWDRRLIENLFGFTYRWEVYVPAAKRRWGYYVLPVLYGNRFVARFEAGRDKKSDALHIIGWWWEDNLDIHDEAMHAALRTCFQDFLNYLGRDHITVDVTVSENLEWLQEL